MVIVIFKYNQLLIPTMNTNYINYYIYIYTLWLFNIAMENGPFIDDFPS